MGAVVSLQVDAIVSLFPQDSVEVLHSKLNLYSYARFLHIRQVRSPL